MLSSDEIIARARLLPATASRNVRDALLSQLRAARAFEALVAKEGSIEAAHAALAKNAVDADAIRNREIAWISGPSPSRILEQPLNVENTHRTSQCGCRV